MTPRIVLLNGAGSAGKTSLARALQRITATPFLYVAMDSFLEMLPPGLWDHDDGWKLVRHEENGRPSVELREGPRGRALIQGTRRAVAALAGAGNDIILDEVLLDGAAADYRRLLADCRVHWIKVDAPLEVLERRELLRGDREIGLSNWQHARVHRDVAYDFAVDTDALTPEEAALAIKDRFGL